jgi:hypothetical protein
MILMKILASLLFGTFCLSSHAASRGPEAKLGQIDLQDWSGAESISLDGEWIFFPNELLNPSPIYSRIAEAQYQTTPIGRGFSFAKLLAAPSWLKARRQRMNDGHQTVAQSSCKVLLFDVFANF